MAVLMIDIDDFKEINDKEGHAADELFDNVDAQFYAEKDRKKEASITDKPRTSVILLKNQRKTEIVWF